MHCSEDFRQHNFVPFKINDLAGESTSHVEMTKDGFAFLVMEREVGDGLIQTVNARDLHAYLGVGNDISTWIKDRIAKFGFVEGVDFLMDLSPSFGEKGQGRDSRDYHLTLDMAKELAMVERNAKGREALPLGGLECLARSVVGAHV